MSDPMRITALAAALADWAPAGTGLAVVRPDRKSVV